MSIRDDIIQSLKKEFEAIISTLDSNIPLGVDELSEITITVEVSYFNGSGGDKWKK